jgi:putative membrane protein
MESTKSLLVNSLKGMAMGIAEVIPGVSGGTIAFITGIYERLLTVIKSIGPVAFQAWRAKGIKGLWEAMDGRFLLSLLVGMAAGIVVGVILITYLLETYPLLIWSFFFGLILVSALFVGRQIRSWNGTRILGMTIGAVLAYYITVAVPSPGNPALYYVFFSGAIAVSALLLPGISGSFILLLMGMYAYIIPTVKSALKTFDPDQLLILVTFAGGMLLGMMVFSRVLTWTFKRFHDMTLAVLTGFLIGSLNKIWPWQEVLETMTKESGETTVVFSRSVLPSDFSALQDNFLYGNDPQVLACILAMSLGFATVLVAEWLSKRMNAAS